MKINLRERFRTAKTYGKIFFKDGDILESSTGYIDTRTIRPGVDELPIVKPLTLEDGFYNYVCPDCGEIHIIHKTRVSKGKPIKTGCCKARSHSTRTIIVSGKLVRVQRYKIFLDVTRP